MNERHSFGLRLAQARDAIMTASSRASHSGPLWWTGQFVRPRFGDVLPKWQEAFTLIIKWVTLFAAKQRAKLAGF